MSDSVSVPNIACSVSNGVAAVQINNPAQRNALTKAMCLQLQDLIPRLDADPDVTIVTVRGAGDTFSAGATINDLSSVLLDPQDDGSTVDQLSRADDAIASLSKPTIAMVDGACMGGGWQIASACDFTVASRRSVFAITPAKIGVIYPRAAVERLVRQVGPANAKFILFTADTFDAQRAAELGLVSEVVPDDQFEQRCDSLTESLKGRSRFSLHFLKRLVDLTAAGDTGLDQEWQGAWAAMAASPDMEIGVAAFLNRKRPVFTWNTPANAHE